jgi:hypothetical protein
MYFFFKSHLRQSPLGCWLSMEIDRVVSYTNLLLLHFTSRTCNGIHVKWSNIPIQHSIWSNTVWYTLGRSWHSYLDYGLFRLPDLKIGLTVDVNRGQKMLTPPIVTWSHLWYIQRPVFAPVANLYFL